MTCAPDAYLFSNDPVHAVAWNPDWASHKVSDLADAAGVDLNIKKLRHYTASQLLAARFDLQNTAAGSATAAAAPLHCTTQTRSPRSIGGRPPTWPT